jgi:V/A-type H+-transporting ATPase subunit D
MIIRVNPNRMELIRLRRRLGLAQRGHKLLQDKLEQMMQRFQAHIKETAEMESNTRRLLNEIMPLFVMAQGKMSKRVFTEAIDRVRTDLDVTLSQDRIMNVRVPAIRINRFEMFLEYNLSNSTAELDVALLRLKKLTPQLISFAESLKTCQILAIEIERTRRRVNALEYILIPSLRQTISSITQKLNELERGNIVRLMSVKELIRSH